MPVIFLSICWSCDATLTSSIRLSILLFRSWAQMWNDFFSSASSWDSPSLMCCSLKYNILIFTAACFHGDGRQKVRTVPGLHVLQTPTRCVSLCSDWLSPGYQLLLGMVQSVTDEQIPERTRRSWVHRVSSPGLKHVSLSGTWTLTKVTLHCCVVHTLLKGTDKGSLNQFPVGSVDLSLQLTQNISISLFEEAPTPKHQMFSETVRVLRDRVCPQSVCVLRDCVSSETVCVLRDRVCSQSQCVSSETECVLRDCVCPQRECVSSETECVLRVSVCPQRPSVSSESVCVLRDRVCPQRPSVFSETECVLRVSVCPQRPSVSSETECVLRDRVCSQSQCVSSETECVLRVSVCPQRPSVSSESVCVLRDRVCPQRPSVFSESVCVLRDRVCPQSVCVLRVSVCPTEAHVRGVFTSTRLKEQ